jgi:hypothetical protein
VSGVRVGTDASKTTRVVVDLDRLCKYELVPGPGEKLTLKLETAAAFESASTPVKVDAPVQTAAANATPAKTQTVKNEASNFLFVEPTFAPKKAICYLVQAPPWLSKIRPQLQLQSQFPLLRRVRLLLKHRVLLLQQSQFRFRHNLR